jgi:hypothetical protein
MQIRRILVLDLGHYVTTYKNVTPYCHIICYHCWRLGVQGSEVIER